ncbi:hypothetical protein BU14_0300s0010 [Porphyra umbilicalis]|uniref:Uncharacterized protein n=1 Tax=Porphyra umbilicalis TaxID=2786 RepID=A0A1X6P0R4_PORUM|nr:hypothetical protein BU14_0300s0010 [Porphyra umbilicalis]|eukprot:OSX74213.1 hypothetical protein BU14_0300s0010 [Porphyra umbilicalis]
MDDVRLPSMAADTTGAVVGALRSVDRLPAVLMFTASLSAATAVRLFDDAPSSAGIECLCLPVRTPPELLLPSLAPLPRLHSLSLYFTLGGGGAPDVHAARPWGVPPALRSLLVSIRHQPVGGDDDGDGGEAQSSLARMRWLLDAVAASPAAGRLASLSLDARVPPGAALDAALAPVVAAGAGALRRVALRVKPIADDGIGKRRRMAAALAAALPRATVTVDAAGV